VNGWQLGKRVGNIGPQTVFPVHEGILDYHGLNTVVLSFWALGSNATDLKLPSFSLIVTKGTYEAAISNVTTNNPGWAQLRT
jgi:hypothetical protein